MFISNTGTSESLHPDPNGSQVSRAAGPWEARGWRHEALAVMSLPSRAPPQVQGAPERVG